MKTSDVMTKNPACCLPDTALPDAAQMMVEHNCGAIPVELLLVPLGIAVAWMEFGRFRVLHRAH